MMQQITNSVINLLGDKISNWGRAMLAALFSEKQPSKKVENTLANASNGNHDLTMALTPNMLQLPEELMGKLLRLLSLASLSALEQSCKKWNGFCKQSDIWESLMLAKGIPKYWGKNFLTARERFQHFQVASFTVDKHYNPKLINLFSSTQALAALPVIDLNFTISNFDDYCHIDPRYMKGHKIKRGFDSGNIPCVLFCVKIKEVNMMQQTLKQYLDVIVAYVGFNGDLTVISQTIPRHYSTSVWYEGDEKKEYCMVKAYLKRLMDNEICDSLIENNDEPNTFGTKSYQLSCQAECVAIEEVAIREEKSFSTISRSLVRKLLN